MAQRRRFSAEYKREEVAMLQSPGVRVSSDDPTMPQRVSHPDDVPVFAGLAQWV